MKLRLLLLSLLLSGSLMAQKAILKGKIVDDTAHGMPGANISIKGTAFGAISNEAGLYTLGPVEAGNYTVLVSYIGFRTVEKEVSLAAGSTVLNIDMEPGLELAEIVVNSRLVGEAKAVNNQKNALNITSMISFEQLERFPDANIGDALKRLPGVNVQYDQGEARFGNVRGTSPALNSVTINGERIPSAEAEIRVVQLDLVPSDMIQSVEFNKAVTPDMDADAIGGSINLVTKAAPYKREVKGTLSTGWNFVSQKPTVKGSLSYGQRFMDNKLGVMVSASVFDNQLGSDNIEAAWNYADENNKDQSAFAEEIDHRQYYIERLRQSYSLGLDYRFNSNHSVYVNAMYNWRNDWENRYRITMTDIEDNGDGTYNIGKLRRQLKFGVADNKYARLEDQRMAAYSLGGDHLIGKLKIDWSASMSMASEERPHERYVRYQAKDVTAKIDYSNMGKPAITFTEPNFDNLTDEYSLNELTDQYQFTEENDRNARINFDLPLASGDYANRLKFGFRFRGKEKMRDNYLDIYEPTDAYADAFDAIVFGNLKDMSKDNFMAGDYKMGSFPKPEISDLFDLENPAHFDKERDLAEEAGDFEAREDVLASYLMFTQSLGSKWTFVAGLRLEQTNLKYKGRIFDVPSEDEADLGAEPSISDSPELEDSYLNVMPGLHIKFMPDQKSNLRFAWTNTIARPNYYDLVPYQEVNRDDEAIAFGNPELRPTTSMNFDLLYERFFQNIGLVSAGVFYKELKDVIAYEYQSDYTHQGTLYQDYRKPENIANASLLGVEMAFSRRLDFLPSVLRNLSLYANYTYTQSQLKDIEFEGREGETLPMAGTPKHTLNLSLAYDTKRVDARVSYNYASAFLNVNDDGGFGEEAFFDFYYDEVSYLDFNLNYKINKNFGVFFDATNLLNQPLSTYVGASERKVQSEYYGVRLNLGARFKF